MFRFSPVQVPTFYSVSTNHITNIPITSNNPVPPPIPSKVIFPSGRSIRSIIRVNSKSCSIGLLGAAIFLCHTGLRTTRLTTSLTLVNMAPPERFEVPVSKALSHDIPAKNPQGKYPYKLFTLSPRHLTPLPVTSSPRIHSGSLLIAARQRTNPVRHTSPRSNRPRVQISDQDMLFTSPEVDQTHWQRGLRQCTKPTLVQSPAPPSPSRILMSLPNSSTPPNQAGVACRSSQQGLGAQGPCLINCYLRSPRARYREDSNLSYSRRLCRLYPLHYPSAPVSFSKSPSPKK